jgi:hypothetical protein
VHKRQRAEARQRDLAPKPEAPKPEARAAKKQFTDLSVKNLRPGATAREVPDGRDGLYCIVQASGHKSWAVRYIFKGKQVKYTIGSYPDVSLADARIAAIEAREQAKSGDDPHAAKKAAKIAEAEAKADTVVAVCESFLALKAKKLRSVDHQRSMRDAHREGQAQRNRQAAGPHRGEDRCALCRHDPGDPAEDVQLVRAPQR